MSRQFSFDYPCEMSWLIRVVFIDQEVNEYYSKVYCHHKLCTGVKILMKNR